MTNNFPNIGRTTLGYGHNYFKKFTVTATSFGGGSVDGYQPDGIITFSTQYVIMINETATADNKIVEYSFNGTTVHGELDCASGSQTVKLEMPYRVVSKIWFRVKSGSTGPLTVSVQAW
jgi:hypothetical protein